MFDPKRTVTPERVPKVNTLQGYQRKEKK